MQESQLAGLLALASGVFAIVASVCDWDWFMNSRKARAWVRRIGRNNARLMYGGIGAFICVVGLILVIVAPGNGSDAADPDVTRTEAPRHANPQPGRSSKPGQIPRASNSSVASTPTTPSADSTGSTATGSGGGVTGRDTPGANSNPSPETPARVAVTQPEPVTTTPETATSERTSVPATVPAEGLDLLALIEPQRDQLKGNWTLQDGALVSPKIKPAILQIPVDVPRSYQLTTVVEMVDGNESVTLGLVVSGRGVGAVIAGPGGAGSGLQMLDGKVARQNETWRPGPALVSGENRIVCTVNQDGLQIECNGETVIDWTGAADRLSYGFEWKDGPSDSLRVGSWNTSCRVSRLLLVPLSEH